MNYYSKALSVPHNHPAPCTVLDWIKMKEENTYLHKIIEGHVGEYEKLVDDILNGREISIEGKRFFMPEVISE